MPLPHRNSLLCPKCRSLISRSEAACPFCGLKKPDSAVNRLLTIGFGDPEQVLQTIIMVNVVMYILSLLLNPGRIGGSFSSPFRFLSPDNQSLLLLGSSGTIPIDRFHRWWTLISANYLHGSLLHIIFNMLALRQLLPLVCAEFGLNRALIIYSLGGAAGYLLSYLAGVQLTLGASAAVCALIGAALYFGKSRGGRYGQAVYSQIGGWALSIFVFGLLVPGINNWAHGGGMAAGALLAHLLGYSERGQERYPHKIMARLCVAATVLTLAWALLSTLLLLLNISG